MAKKFKFICWLLFVLGLGWHLQAVWHQQLFGDEIHSLFFFQEHSWTSLLLTPVEPIHPNGYYLLIKLLYLITPSVMALRAWMLVIFVASCGALLKILQKVGLSNLVIAGALAIWSSSAYLWHFSFQLRMYGPAVLIILLSLLALLNKKPWLSVFFDWLALSLAYGAIIFILAKWGAWFLQKIELKKIWPILVSLMPVTIVLGQFLAHRTVIDASYLYWVHPVVWPDLSLGLLSYLTGLFLPYFEGFSELGKTWLSLGSILNFCLVIFMIAAAIFLYFKCRLAKKLWTKIPKNQQLLLLMSSICLLIYGALFAWSLVMGGHLFHIRQTLVVAMAAWLLFFWSLEKISQKLPWLALLLVFSIVGVNQLSIVKDSLGSGQAYLHHFQSLPGAPVIASPTDVELIYKQCHTFDRKKAGSICQQHDIYLTNELPTSWENWSTWWLTTSAKNNLKISANCQQLSIDFWECEKTSL